MRSRRLDRRGSALILAMGFMVVVLIVALGVHILVTGQLRSSGDLRQRVAAEYLAQGGVAQAVAWFNSQGYLLPQSSMLIASVPVRLAGDSAPVVLPANHPDGYTDMTGQTRSGVVTGYNSYLTAHSLGGGTYSTVASLISLSPEVWELLATAQYGTAQQRVGAIIYRQYDPLFAEALFGKGSATLQGSALTDSYDAALGAYGGSNRYQNGDVRSNGGISLSGNATIKGDAIPGPSMLVNPDNGRTTGSTTPAQTPKALPQMVLPGSATTLGAVMLESNQTQTLNAGTYIATSLSVTGNARLTINGPVILYVTGSIIMGGSGLISTSSGKPQDFQVFQYGGANVTIADNANFYGALYAPDSPLDLHGNATLYGALIAESVSVQGNATVHYDQSLSTLSGPPGPLKLTAQWTLPSP